MCIKWWSLGTQQWGSHSFFQGLQRMNSLLILNPPLVLSFKLEQSLSSPKSSRPRSGILLAKKGTLSLSLSLTFKSLLFGQNFAYIFISRESHLDTVNILCLYICLYFGIAFECNEVIISLLMIWFFLG